ncbi:acetyl-CoA carboxylase biotin carboxylase subunit family protein [Paenibacillus sp. S150]|uniref:ATP-grasp domain-containing protein n=1 Tax=Paenibacillus sp. S150 TaxID=2749826 RepID=UPI001C560206|nr:ATP-grasp domain-containing protein [Paenibacillus sp. S150]MBW4084506.1 ATP-grasp domain-containing protein [Paenibacillus sp. S150]
MNFIFFSPHFPKNSADFCSRLQQQGATVLGIGDAEYDRLEDKLKAALTEYYKVSDLENYDEILRAVGYFTHKYGKIDRFESLNEYWLEQDAAIRTDFNIYGTKTDFVYNLKQKSKMKEFFRNSGVSTVQFSAGTTRDSALEFIRSTGFPLVVKPDLGSGASMTYKINNTAELQQFFDTKPDDVAFIIEEFIDGVILTYDGLVDIDGNVRFAVSHLFENSVMDVVNTDNHLYYFCLKDISPEVELAGRNILKAFGIKERFFHIEMFKSNKDGRIIALEVNMRPPGAWMTDAINFSYDVDVYREWARMIVHNETGGPYEGKYYTGYASRKNHKRYAHNHEDICRTFGSKIVNYAEIEEVFSRAMGNSAYQFRSPELEEVRAIVNYIQLEEG